MTDTNKRKVITLPLTCKQIVWILAPTAHILLIIGFILTIFTDTAWIPLVMFPGMGVMGFWVYHLVMWDLEGKLPSIRCKCESTNTSEEM